VWCSFYDEQRNTWSKARLILGTSKNPNPLYRVKLQSYRFRKVLSWNTAPLSKSTRLPLTAIAKRLTSWATRYSALSAILISLHWPSGLMRSRLVQFAKRVDGRRFRLKPWCAFWY